MGQGLSIARLETFLAVVDAGGIARAAPQDAVRQSQMSRQVGELERHLGRALLERQGRGVVVTPAGERLASLARELLGGLEEVRREAEEAPLPFTLGAGDSLLHWWVMPRIGELREQAPRAIPSLVGLASSDVTARVLDGRLDFGLIRADESPGELVTRPIATITYKLFAPQSLVRDTGDGFRALLATVPLALQSSEPALNDRLLAAARRLGVTVPALWCETFPQLCSAVLSGAYAALLPSIAEVALPNRTVSALDVPGGAAATAKVRLAWHPRSTRRRAGFEHLAEALAACLQREE